MGKEIGELLGDALDMCGAGDYSRSRSGGEGKQTIPSRLDEGAAFECEVEQELRMSFSGEGPKSGSRSACGNDHVEPWNLTIRERIRR